MRLESCHGVGLNSEQLESGKYQRISGITSFFAANFASDRQDETVTQRRYFVLFIEVNLKPQVE